MKTEHLSQSRFLPMVIVIVLAVTSCGTVPEQGPTPSTVMKLDSAARYSLDGKTWTVIKVGDWIPSGSVVQTAQNGIGLVVISLGEPITAFNMPVPSGGLYDPAVHPANLLGLGRDTVVKLRSISSEKLPGSHGRKEEIELSLVRGGVRGNVKPHSEESTYEVQFKDCLFTMRDGKYAMDDSGNISVWDGQVEICVPSQNLTNQLTTLQEFDAKTGVVTNLPPPLPFSITDSISEPWAKPPHVKSMPRADPEMQLRF